MLNSFLGQRYHELAKNWISTVGMWGPFKDNETLWCLVVMPTASRTARALSVDLEEIHSVGLSIVSENNSDA
uniref:Uncharacterized protein n=1 Tax=Rhinolophus ferrumequinum TaxID=59479 RepID=A0A671E688_RHIFE